jgi:DNA replication and repair protein RecF
VHLSRLSLRDFRNLGRQELFFPPEGAAIVGENAQGKSNLLESIYYLETFRSFRGGRDEQLVGFGAEAFHVAATLQPQVASDRPVEVTAAFQKRGKRKKVTVDGAETERIGDALGRLAAVIFSPADVALVNGGPAARRRFLDIVLSLNREGYLEALQRYRHVLAQRNATLKREQPAAVVQVWDEPLIRSGTAVLRDRWAWVARWAETFARYYRSISGGQGCRMTHHSGVPVAVASAPGAGEIPGPEEVATSFREALCAAADRERRTGSTVVGPHRDDLRLTLAREGGEIDLRDYGSGGQRRTAALALRLTEAETIRTARGQEPVVLMDDVFAELDAGRSDRILELIEREETGQVILTAPKEGDVRVRRDTLPRWRIAAGELFT